MLSRLRCINLCLTLVIVAGCGDPTKRVESSAAYSGFLSDYAMLQAGGEGEGSLLYWNPDADYAAFDKILLEPVMVWMGPDSDLRHASPEDRQRLAAAFYTSLYDKLSQDFELVSATGPGVMRLRAAITEANPASAAMDTVTTYLPPAALISSGVDLAVGSEVSAFVADAAIEAELTDSATGERLGAVVDRRAGTKAINRNTFSAWSDVYRAFDVWATQLSANLRAKRGQ